MKAKPQYTARQGQYLAFIDYYTKIQCQAPAEADLQRYFEVSPAAVHQMLHTLEAKDTIKRERGKARAMRLMVSREALPDLE